MRPSPPDAESAPRPEMQPPPRRGPPRDAKVAWRNSIVTIVLAGLAAYLGANVGSRPTHRLPLPLSERVFEVLNEGIQLSESQKETIRGIGERYTPMREQLRMQSRAHNVRLAQLMADEQGFGPQTTESLQQLQLVMGERLKLSMRYMLEVRAVLTAEQKAYFDRKVAEEASLSR
jgi:hypothetical protein